MALESFESDFNFYGPNRRSDESTLTSFNLEATQVNKVVNESDYIPPKESSILRVAESYGANLGRLSVDAGGHIISKTNEVKELPELFEELESNGVNPAIRIFDSSSIPDEYSEFLRDSRRSRYVVLEHKSKRFIGNSKVSPLGYVKFDYESDDDDRIPTNVSYRIFENPTPVDTFDEEAFSSIDKTLKTLSVSELDSTFRDVLDNLVDETTLDQEKFLVLTQLAKLQADANKIGIDDLDLVFLYDYEEKILNGEYDEVFKEAINDTIAAVAMTQVVAIAGAPLVGTLVGNATDAKTGALAAGAIYYGAPIPAWVYTELKNAFKYRGSFPELWKTGGSFLAMNLIPLIGPGVAFPLSIDAQTKGDLSRFRRILRQHPELSNEITKKEKVVDMLIHGIALNEQREENLADTQEVVVDYNWNVQEVVSITKDTNFEIVQPDNEEAEAELRRFVAKQHIKYNLSKPGDENIVQVGVDQDGHPVYEMIDKSGIDYDWIVVRNSNTGDILIASKMYNRGQEQSLPFQDEIQSRDIKKYGKVPFKGEAASISDFLNIHHEIASLAFNNEALRRLGKDKGSRFYRGSIAMLTWLRGLESYMRHNEIDRFGSIFTTKASRFLSTMGNLGMEFLSDPFYYMPDDEDNGIESQFMRLDYHRAQYEMMENNPAIYKFVFEGKINDKATRKQIWDEFVERNVEKRNEKKGLKDVLVKTLQKAYLRYVVNGII